MIAHRTWTDRKENENRKKVTVGSTWEVRQRSNKMRTRGQRKQQEEEKKRAEKEASVLFRYQDLMTKYPLPMNLAQGILLTAFGSAVASQISGEKTDWNDIVIMSFVNATLITPILMWWFTQLSKMTLSNYSKVFVDQFVFGPVFTTSIIAYKFILMKYPLEEVVKLCIMIVPNAVAASWIFWIPQRYITFNFLSPSLHMPFGTLCAFFWNVIFSIVVRK